MASVLSRNFSPALFKFSTLELPVQKHLTKVYTCLGVGMLTATAGACFHLFIHIVAGGFLSALLASGLLLWLGMTKHNAKNITKRIKIFMAFTFLSGISLGPLLEMALWIDPSIIPTALLGTSAIFITFSLSAIFNRKRTYLYMGGFLMSAMTCMMMLSVARIFFHSSLIFNAYLYGSLLIFCAFVLYHTQLTIEKRRLGDDDFIWHSVDLFLDFINIFRKLLIILSMKEKKNKRRQ